MIRVSDVYKIYQMGEVPVHALNGVSLEIEKGEFVGIAGASGSGKSTLLHMIGLLDTPTSGSIEISGTDVLKLPDYEKTLFRLEWLGFVFQDYALSSELTAYENVILPLMARGVSDSEMEERALHMLDQVGLMDRALHLPKELSGGEQQRVAIARGLVNEPAILLADEPCGNLDTKNSTIILDLIAEINRESRQTVLMISHEDEHQQYCERVITLSDGKIMEG